MTPIVAVGDAVWITVTGAVVAVMLIVAVVVALVMRREMRAELGGMKVTLGHVDNAVNNRHPDSLTISEEVSLIHSKVNTLDKRTTMIENDPATNRLASELSRLSDVLSNVLIRLGVLEHPSGEVPVIPTDPPAEV